MILHKKIINKNKFVFIVLFLLISIINLRTISAVEKKLSESAEKTVKVSGKSILIEDIKKIKEKFTDEEIDDLYIGKIALIVKEENAIQINTKINYTPKEDDNLFVVDESNMIISEVKIKAINPHENTFKIIAGLLPPENISIVKVGDYVIHITSLKDLGSQIGKSIKSKKNDNEQYSAFYLKGSMPVISNAKITIIDKEITEKNSIKYESKMEDSMEKETEAVRIDPGEKITVSKSASGLKAGFSDDNKQFNYFIDFIENNANEVQKYPINVKERIILKIKDSNGFSLPNSKVDIYADKELLTSGLTYPDGSFLFFPSEYSINASQYEAVIFYGQAKTKISFSRSGKRNIEARLDYQKTKNESIPLDILFIFDVTGSMGEEISRLKSSLEIINLNIAAISPKPKVRFGMVQYKDINDDFTTKIVPLTDDLDKFQGELKKISAEGGGDLPEDLQSALKDTIEKIEWNNGGIRLGFIITDAPPQLYKDQRYTYVDAVRDAKKNSLKLFSIGTGGLNLTGEYVLRQISQYTYAKYIFLTYGEKGDSQGGKAGSVSHHTGSNYETDKLEAIIIRIAKEELGSFYDLPVEEEEDYFDARSIKDEKKEETLKNLFSKAISQLVDYSSFKIAEKTPVSILSINTDNEKQKKIAEYFAEQFTLSLMNNKKFTIVERQNMQIILEELKLSMSGFADESNAVKIGKFVGADLLITGKLYLKEKNYEMFIKMLRVETGEIISVTKLIIDFHLGL